MSFKFKIIVLIASATTFVQASPIDWKGSFAFDSYIMNDVRRTSEDCTTADGSQCINNEENNARFQTMILRLNPNIIVNDALTIKGELSTGSGASGVRGSRLGESTQLPTSNSVGNSFYTQSTRSELVINQLYAEIYADTALYKIGRFSKHWGLGTLVNSGENTFDRFYSGYEGVEAQLKLGSFHLTPMWAKLHTSDQPNGSYDSYETSVEALYDNANRNLKVGVYYSLREVETNDTLYATGSQKTTLIDIFVKKQWDRFSLGLEIPMLSGKINNLYNTGDADFDTNAYILETNYKANSKWDVGLNAGMVKGDDGSTSSFEGMYLNPNYKHSHLLFKYNNRAFNTAGEDIFNASIVNATYANLFAHYNSGEWTWKMSAFWAMANEVASTGSDFFDHDQRKVVTAMADQSDDLGYEFNLSFDYKWNPNITVSGLMAYHIVGDYYSFANDANNELDTANVLLTGMNLAISF